MALQAANLKDDEKFALPDCLWKEVFEWGVLLDGGAAPRELTEEFADACRHTGVINAVMDHPWRFPWNISFVSRKWRLLALDTPTLWNDVYVSIPTRHRLWGDLPSFTPGDTQRILDRCKAAPIHVEVCGLAREPSTKTWAIVLANKQKIVTWKLLWKPEEDLARLAFTKRKLEQWTSLTTLDLELESSHGVDVPKQIDFSGCHQLRRYRERGSWNPQTSIRLPLDSLRSITLYLPFGFIGARLGAAPNLEHLTVKVDQPSQWLSTNKMGLTIENYVHSQPYWPKLKQLYVRNCSLLTRFAIRAPVEDLNLEINTETESLGSLAPLLKYSMSSVRHLVLKGGLGWTDELIRRNITSLTNVEEMRVSVYLSSNDIRVMVDDRLPPSLWASGLEMFLRELLVTRGSVPCPYLCSLEIDVSVQGKLSQSTWRWLQANCKGFTDCLAHALGMVWESRLPENGKKCRSLDVCSLSVFAGSHGETRSGVQLLTSR